MQDSTTVVDPVPGLRERKKRARREALIEAAHALVGAHGLEAVTVESICARAGVSTRTFFNYFASKDDAVLGLDPWQLDTDVAAVFVAGGPTGHLGADLEHLVLGLVDRPPVGRHRIACAMALARREPALLTRQVSAFHRHHSEIAELIGRRLDLEPTSPRVELVTMLVMTVVRATYVHWQDGDEERDVRELVPEVLAQVRELLVEPPGDG